ncbi:putative ATP-dependent transporter SufC [subsurface metagenome]
MSSDVLLSVKDISILSEDRQCNIVDTISFDVMEGSIHSIIGPNGAGKSTLGYAIMGVYHPCSGKIFFKGKDITDLSITERAKRGITLAWQTPARFDGLSVYDYIAVGIKDKNLIEQRVREALEIVNLDPDIYLKRKVDANLSGGERKRIELASVIAMRPKLVILDEAEAGMDLIVLESFMDIFNKIKELGMTILLITHREDIGMVSDNSTLLWEGKVLVNGPFREVMLHYCEKAGLRQICNRTLFERFDQFINGIIKDETQRK